MTAQQSTDIDQIKITPLSVHTGAEISGVNLCRPLTSSQISQIRQALLQWKVIFFRDQELTHAEHVSLAKQFGEPTPAHVVFGSDSEYPEIYPVVKHRTAQAGNVTVRRAWTGWHTDITAAINPPSASILRSVVLPPYGGDTQWLNMVKAFEALSPPMQKFLSSLRAIHQYRRASSPKDKSAYNDLIDAKAMVSEHPLVTVHPETSERALFVNAAYVDHIVGLTPRESHCLLEYLLEHCLQSEFMVRFRWSAGSVAFWDNRATQHQAIGDIFETDFDRELYRITLNGEIPVGVDGRESTAVSGEPIKPV
ncbi:MAG: TauD/TfdA family dioxygenase [Proteobacteria bacterium]|nr:TauD/TfdA family dioxygenase [Pseudomonadota bacterium]